MWFDCSECGCACEWYKNFVEYGEKLSIWRCGCCSLEWVHDGHYSKEDFRGDILTDPISL